MDDNSNTPTEMFVGLRPWNDWYYLVIIIEYLLMLPIWMILWNVTIGPLLVGILERYSK